ncbi:serine/threonine protein kinase [Sphaerisporangium aureirubrum]|uniref:Protein kinase n=1 Tax=Sphaerisporangium aureirubrum TaxID=1544736 RepID=A0ABW1NE02_9ACTN
MTQDDRLGPYRLLRRLGAGGMGVVHLALDSHGRQVAVKVLRAEVAGDDVARRRLSREVETMRRVRSRYIAEVLDADVTGSRPYIVTRYVAGMPLDEAVKQDGPLGVAALLRVAHGVADALAAVHAAGVIHRDLKPGNVLLLDGEPVLIDFGIAQAVDATRLTQTGMFIGTPGYLAPEIIEGHEAGSEVDVHAWAGTLLYAATGQPPFGKGTLEMVFYNITAGKANIDAAPAILQPLLRGAFQRDPAKRPTAVELAAQLSRLAPPPAGSNRPRSPDEIRTMPDMSGLTPEPTNPSRKAPATGPAQGPPAGPAGPARGPVTGPPVGAGRPTGAAAGPVAGADEYVSLLKSPQAPGDPWPTVRVTGDELRAAGLPTPVPRPGAGDSAEGRTPEGDVPTRFAPPATGSYWQAAQQPAPDQGEVPTRRVRPEELALDRDAQGRNTAARPGHPGQSGPQGHPGQQGQNAQPSGQPGQGTPYGQPGQYGQNAQHVQHGQLAQHGQEAPPRRQQGYPAGQAPTPYGQSGPAQGGTGQGGTGQGGAGHGARPGSYNQALFEQPSEVYERTPHVRGPVQPAQNQGYVPTVHLPPDQTPAFVGAGPARTGLPETSALYGVASILALIIVVGAAVVAPVLASAVVVPAAVLLRAADIAHQKHGRSGLLRGFAPGALLKSIGVTLALVPYALILGVPVTLVLAFLVRHVPVGTCLSWGVAVSLWIVCAGPGVEGPGRQMRRTLAAAFPERGAAIGLASITGLLAAAVTAYAVMTLVAPAGDAIWSPVNIDHWLQELQSLRRKAG